MSDLSPFQGQFHAIIFKFSMLLKIKLKIEKKNPCSYNSILPVFLQPDTPGSNTWEKKLSQLNLSIFHRASRPVSLIKLEFIFSSTLTHQHLYTLTNFKSYWKHMVLSVQGARSHVMEQNTLMNRHLFQTFLFAYRH